MNRLVLYAGALVLSLGACVLAFRGWIGQATDGRPHASLESDDVHVAAVAGKPKAGPASLPASDSVGVDREAGPSLDPRASNVVLGNGEIDAPSMEQISNMLSVQLQQQYRSLDEEVNRPGSGPGGEKTLSDAIREVESLALVRRKEAARHLLMQGRYVTYKSESGSVNDVRLERNEVPVRIYHAAVVGGVMVDLLIRVPQTHDLVHAVESELVAMRGARLDEEIKSFNAMDIVKRRERCLESTRAVESARELRRDVTLPAEERDRRLAEIVARMLPGQWAFSSDYTAYRK